MTNEERDLIARFVARVGGAPQQGGFLPGPGGSVPQSQTPLPPIDREAEPSSTSNSSSYPEARYRITQMAVVQEAALAEMNNRLNAAAMGAGAGAQRSSSSRRAQQQQQSRGLFGSLFGGGSAQPQPQRGGGPGAAPAGRSPAMAGRNTRRRRRNIRRTTSPACSSGGGSGFLGSALTTAAGVAGGLVVGNALMNAFSGHSGIGEAARRLRPRAGSSAAAMRATARSMAPA